MRTWLRRLAWVLAVIGVMWVLAGLVSPYVQPADGGELQLVVRDLGVAHPPGYALYTVVAHAFGRVAGNPVVAQRFGFHAAQVSADGYGGASDRWTVSTNLFSALLAALTLLTVLATARLLTRSLACGLLAAVALAFGPTFLAQSTVANIRMPTALVTALLLYTTIWWLGRDPAEPGAESGVRAGSPGGGGLVRGIDWGVVAIVFVAGLAVGHHPSLAPVALLAGVLVLVRRPSVLRDAPTLAASAVAVVVSLLPLLYLPLRDRADATLAPGSLDSLEGLLTHVTGFGFRGDVLGAGDPIALADRALVVWNIALIQFGPVLLILGLVGAVWLALLPDAARRLSVVLLIGTVLGMALLAVVYRAPQTMEYLVPAYVALAVLIGCAGGAVIEAAKSLAARLGREPPASCPGGTAIVLLLAVAILVARRDLPAQVVAAQPSPWPVEAVLEPECAPEGSTVLASWHHVTPMWYMTGGNTRRPDMDIEYVYPEGAEPIGETWLRRLDQADGPVVVTNRSGEMIAADAALQPLPGTPFFTTERTGCFRLSGDPDFDTAVGAAFEDLVVLDHVHLPELTGAPPKTPMLAELRATGIVSEPLTVFAQLIDPVTGNVYGQVDRTVSPQRWNDPDGLMLRLPIEPFREEAARLQAVVGVYRRSEDGIERLAPRLAHRSPKNAGEVFPRRGPNRTVVVGTVWDSRYRSIQSARRVLLDRPRNLLLMLRDAALGLRRADEILFDPMPPLDVDPPDDAIPFGDAMWLVDSDVRLDDGQLVVDLTWLSENAYVSDYVVSVQAEGDGLFAQHDGIPAQGAIPTLKWLPGMVVRDRHRIDLPDAAAPGTPLAVSVGVYDAFSLEPLPVTRRDLAAAGQGQRAVIADEAF